MDRISNAITDFYIRKNYIPSDKKDIYCYGFKLIIADIINFLMVLFFGALLGMAVESVAFLLTLCGIRIFSGGFHAETFWLCRLSMLITFAFVMLFSYILSNSIYEENAVWIINCICVIIIGVLAPVKHPNKSLTQKQVKRNKLSAIIIALIMAAISIMMVNAGIYTGIIMSVTLISVAVLMVIALIVQRGGKDNV